MLKRLLRHPLVCLVVTLVLTGLLSAALSPVLRPLLLGLASPELRELHRLSVGPLLSALYCTVAVLVVGRYLQREPPAKLGFSLRRFWPHLGWGLLVGAGLMGAVVGLFALLGWYRVEATGETLGEELREAGVYLYAFAAVAYSEELMVRGIIFRLLEQWLGSTVALLVSSALFGAGHLMNPDATVYSSVAIAVEAGLLLGAAYMLTRSLWFAVGIHWAWNWVQGPLLGVDVSGMKMDGLVDSALVGPVAWTGGPFGAEGGYTAVLLCTAAGVALAWAAARRGQWLPFLHWRKLRREERAREAAASPPAPAPVDPSPAG
ncbi:CPBP family intramembrane metalloprotease [Aggregicoccus sp. 17bor-14]|uniref:CPBP family intramembrane glutamic endopeptidase n=1 Tax=Myxococcaceae TaxID=31 RepID=UPI00129CD332|nr:MULTISPECIES: type II CAAX endopeptidase family protein [Myxococcaceae]MBF5043073.1 CPBP family intramembrane metalloprotease [Simulacricoccus sp. 17bor-14]MRI88836.1 CPBP family intramembrane metalloprotease [Aggregicoccus sp. 17bor-14]